MQKAGPDGVHHAVNKPFSDQECSKYLFEIGAVLSLLPPPPGRLLDIGCGTGWTSRFFAKRGYQVLGIDICEDAIREAAKMAEVENLQNLRFEVGDYEEGRFKQDFDCAVFFDSLHHAVDEQLAVNMAYGALKPGGVCVTSEPGTGHQDQPHSIEAMERFNVTEKDMPPKKIIQLGKKAGFQQFRVVPHAFDLNTFIYKSPLDTPKEHFSAKGFKEATVQTFSFVLSVLEDSGMVRMVK